MRWATLPLLVIAACLAGCGGGGSDDEPSTALPPSSGDGSLVELTIASASVRNAAPLTARSDADLPTAEVIRFRRIDLPESSVRLACFETTRGQWTAIATAGGLADDAHARPWKGVAEAGASGTAAEGLPATCLTTALAAEVLAAYRGTTGVTLRLPSETEWLAACLGGESMSYSWGEDEKPEDVRTYALVAETRFAGGPEPAGGRGATRRSPNRMGFTDMHGNAWELLAPNADGMARLRGGSWADNLRSARSSTPVAEELDVSHALIGVRLILDGGLTHSGEREARLGGRPNSRLNAREKWN